MGTEGIHITATFKRNASQKWSSVSKPNLGKKGKTTPRSHRDSQSFLTPLSVRTAVDLQGIGSIASGWTNPLFLI